MRIRKQSKQALLLIFNTLIVVFAVALLLVTIVDLNADNTPQLIGNTAEHQTPQSPPQPGEAAPPPAEEQQYAQEPPDENPAASSAIKNDLAEHEAVSNSFDFKGAAAIIGLIVLFTVVVGGAALLVYHLTRKRFYSYESDCEEEELAADEIAEYQEWESGFSNRTSAESGQAGEPEPVASAETSNASESAPPEEPDIDFVDIPRLFSMRADS